MDSLSHNLRQYWRLRLVRQWLNSSRNDAVIARQSNLFVSIALVDQLRSFARDRDGHVPQVMCGGLRTQARAMVIPLRCDLCGQAVGPSTQHIYWECPAFNEFRIDDKPRHELAAHMGWGPDGVHVQIIEQMAKIRSVCAKLYYQNGVFGRPPNDDGGRWWGHRPAQD